MCKIKLDQDQVAKVARQQWKKSTIPNMQIAIYVMCGGGVLGTLAAEQPADFYIDGRTGRLPYKKAQIRQAVETLKTFAIIHGLDPHRLPYVPQFHNMGIF